MSEFIPLHQLLRSARPPEQAQALLQARGHLEQGQETVKTWSDWRVRVAQWQTLLASLPGERWALYHDDAFEFSAALFALWGAGKIACVPGSTQTLIVEKLAERVDGFIGEFPTQTTLTAPNTPIEFNAIEPVLLDPERLVMEVFTSGSSGEPQAIPKQLFQLANEIANLHALWHTSAKDALFLASVSHHHIYGLLFRVLWPLAAGEIFADHLCEYFEDVQRVASRYNKVILISSPTHLSRIPSATDWQLLKNRCCAIFSSGAPLSKEASINTKHELGLAPIEVFGSSETGGIATRQQSASEDIPWQPVPGLTIGLDAATECLKIQSPYITNIDSASSAAQSTPWYVTSDRVDILDSGKFFLKGRADNIAKVEGKRVSVTEMERRLLAHEWISEAKVVLLEGQRTELGAVIVLNQTGAERLQQQGKLATNKVLQQHLLAQFERPVLPRRWRFVPEMPYNNQGKITQLSLLAFFADQKNGAN